MIALVVCGLKTMSYHAGSCEGSLTKYTYNKATDTSE